MHDLIACVHHVENEVWCHSFSTATVSIDRMARKGRKKPVTSAYQRFIKETLAKLKKEFPNMEHRERFQRASQQWSSRLHQAETSSRAPRDRGSH